MSNHSEPRLDMWEVAIFYRMESPIECLVGDNREGAKSNKDGSLQIGMRM